MHTNPFNYPFFKGGPLYGEYQVLVSTRRTSYGVLMLTLRYEDARVG